jgi:hypothetical protein
MSKSVGFASLLVLSVFMSSAQESSNNNQPSPYRVAQCEYSDGKSITVKYPSVLLETDKPFRGVGTDEGGTFVTNENLVTVRGTNISPGEYTFSIASHADRWDLTLMKISGDSTIPNKSRTQEIARVPLSVMKFPRPTEKFGISFDHDGGSCMMKMRWWNTQASLEFAERNTDLPLAN